MQDTWCEQTSNRTSLTTSDKLSSSSLRRGSAHSESSAKTKVSSQNASEQESWNQGESPVDEQGGEFRAW